MVSWAGKSLEKVVFSLPDLGGNGDEGSIQKRLLYRGLGIYPVYWSTDILD